MSTELKRSINNQLERLNTEEERLENYIEGRLRVANDGYYVAYARNKARQEATKAQNRIDEIINRKIELHTQIKTL